LKSRDFIVTMFQVIFLYIDYNKKREKRKR